MCMNQAENPEATEPTLTTRERFFQLESQLFAKYEELVGQIPDGVPFLKVYLEAKLAGVRGSAAVLRGVNLSTGEMSLDAHQRAEIFFKNEAEALVKSLEALLDILTLSGSKALLKVGKLGGIDVATASRTLLKLLKTDDSGTANGSAVEAGSFATGVIQRLPEALQHLRSELERVPDQNEAGPALKALELVYQLYNALNQDGDLVKELAEKVGQEKSVQELATKLGDENSRNQVAQEVVTRLNAEALPVVPAAPAA
jgi:hypothetical protein